MLMIDAILGGENNRVIAYRITGMPAHLAFFYCVWQTNLFPSWCIGGKLDNAVARQALMALQSMSCSGILTIGYESNEFRIAYDDAVKACEAVGIDIKIVSQ